MRKLNSFLFIMLILAITNLVHGQTVKTVYTIGSTYSLGTYPDICYPATPAAIQPPASGNTYLPPNNATNNSYVVTGSTPAPIYDIIIKAYDRGFRHFYFQEGLYIIDTPINLDGLNGITIEGGGAGTVFKPANTTLATIFDVKNCYNGKIKNLGIDLKTTIACGTGGQDTNDINTGIKIGTQVGRCLFENIFFRSNIANNATVIGTSPILVKLIAGQESDWNTFNNIQFQRSRGGIVLDITGSDNPDDLASNGVFNHNTFSNIHLEHCLVGVDFIGNGGTIEGNLFSNFDVQASKDTDGGLRLRTTDIVRNIRGINNTFQNFNIGDFNACTAVDVQNGCSAIGYVFSITNKAERTVIENTETEGNFVTGYDAKNGWYIDGGIGTQFINNASTNRLTDYIKRNLNDVILIGQNSPNPVANTGTAYNFDANASNSANKNYFRVDNFGSVLFNGRTQNLKKVSGTISQETYLGSTYISENFGSYTFGNFKGGAVATNPFTATGSTFIIKGNGQFQPHVNGILNSSNGYYINSTTPTCILTNANNNGALQWTKISDVLSIAAWNHIAAKNINMSNFALTNVSNTAATPPLAATDPANPENPANTLPGLRLDATGNVRIGTTAPFGTNPAKLQVDGRAIIGEASQDMNDYDPAYKLIVNGKVRVRSEVYVKQGGLTWPDYVFVKDYKLMPLQQVEQHIQQKGYLPNMPSAAEVEKDGIAVGNIIKLQQEKIEELTLYLIEMKKQNDEMQKRMAALENNKKK